MNKKYILIWMVFLLIVSSAVGQSTSTMTLTGMASLPFYLEQVSSNQNDYLLKLKVTRTNTAQAENYTVALFPVSTARQTWKYNYTQGTQLVRQANIYTSRQTNQSSDIAKSWGIEQSLAATNVWTGSFNIGQSEVDLDYYLHFQDWTENPPPYGTYQLDLEFRLWPVSFANFPLSPPSNIAPKTLPVTLTVIIGSYVYVSFADQYGLPINGIALEETSIKTVDFKMLAKANMPFDVTVSSTNGGSLNLNTGSGIEKIQYSLWIHDMTTPINFQQTPIKTVLSNQPTMGHGVPPILENARIQVLFDSNANYTAGKYSDALQLVIKSHW